MTKTPDEHERDAAELHERIVAENRARNAAERKRAAARPARIAPLFDTDADEYGRPETGTW